MYDVLRQEEIVSWCKTQHYRLYCMLLFIERFSGGGYAVEHSNSGKKSFDSILATELIFSIRFDSPI